MRPPLTVFSDAPQAFAPRAAWTLQTMLAPLGRRLVLTREPAHAGAAALAYTSAPVPGVPTIPCSAAALAMLAAERPLPAGSFAPRSSAAGSAVGAFAAAPPDGPSDFAASFDVLASAFVLLACWDEHTSSVRDEFGRLPYAASVFAANPALKVEEPAVDRYVQLLRTVLEPRLAELGLEPLPAPGWMWDDRESTIVPGGDGRASPGARFAVALTHDIDHLWRWTPREFAAVGYRSARAVRRRDGAALRWELGDVVDWAIRHVPSHSDSYWTFPQMLDGENVRGVSSTFFVIAHHSHPRDGIQPRVYQRHVGRALRQLADARREVGLHGNDRDRLGPPSLIADRRDLEARAGSPVRGMRYHYLRCLYHETLAHLEQAGFEYDSSMAFAEHEGYRCGASFPFRPYSLREERPLRLLELPLAVMDTSLAGAQYRALAAAAAEHVSRAILSTAQASGGAAAILWHNLRFDRRAARGYDDAYWHLVEWAQAQGAFVGSAGAIVQRWRQSVEDMPG